MSSSKRAHVHQQHVPQTFRVKTWKQKEQDYTHQQSRFGTVAGGQKYLLGGFFWASTLTSAIRKTNHLKRSNAVSKQEETNWTQWAKIKPQTLTRVSDPWHKRWWTGNPRVLDLTDLLESPAGRVFVNKYNPTQVNPLGAWLGIVVGSPHPAASG